MKKISSLILALSLFLGSQAFALGNNGGPKSGQKREILKTASK